MLEGFGADNKIKGVVCKREFMGIGNNKFKMGVFLAGEIDGSLIRIKAGDAGAGSGSGDLGS